MCFKPDDKAFIFTLKNPHGVKPTRFMKRKDSDLTIACWPMMGPVFGADTIDGSDITLLGVDNKQLIGFVTNDGTKGFECHPKYKASLFVNTAGINERNYFFLGDYEVFERV